jgi:hypothetical protein
MFTSIFDNIACVRGTTFGGSLLESLKDVIEQKYWLRRSVFALSSYTNSPVDPLYYMFTPEYSVYVFFTNL